MFSENKSPIFFKIIFQPPLRLLNWFEWRIDRLEKRNVFWKKSLIFFKMISVPPFRLLNWCGSKLNHLEKKMFSEKKSTIFFKKISQPPLRLLNWFEWKIDLLEKKNVFKKKVSDFLQNDCTASFTIAQLIWIRDRSFKEKMFSEKKSTIFFKMILPTPLRSLNWFGWKIKHLEKKMFSKKVSNFLQNELHVPASLKIAELI